MDNETAIGIDLGTTNSCVAIYRNNKVDILENEMGSRTTPSCVTFTKDSILTGPEAVEEAHRHPKSAIFEAKRLIGQKFSDSKVQDDIRRFPFAVFNDLGSPKIRIELEDGETRDYYPEDISAYILQRMKRIAETRTKETITRAVVTVPAYFNDAQRQATKDAAAIAGFKTVHIINEPTAAALAFDHEHKKQHKRNILVYDFGGGTFDVSVVTVGRSMCKVVATRGDSHLGGTDIDSNLVNYLKESYKTKFDRDIDCNVMVSRRLKSKSEEAKKALSGQGRYSYDVEMDQLGAGEQNYFTAITRIRLESLNAPLFQSTIDCVEQCLIDCNLRKEDIDEVVLVGGSSKIPKIQELIRERFGADKINQGVNPDEAVAYGAAIYAANLAGADKTAVAAIVDVTSLSIGTNVENDKMSVIIPRNTPLPAKAIVRYQTVYESQSSMDFPIFQGENIVASENVALGEFTMTGLTEAPAKQVRVEICCRIDKEGILSISATEVNANNNTKKVTVDVDRCGLTKEQIEQRILDAEINNERARKRQKFDEEKYLLEKLLSRTIEHAEKLDTADKDKLLDRYDEISKWLENAKVPDVDRIVEINFELKNLFV